MMDVVIVRKLGTSVIITLPRTILKSTHLKVGDRVTLDTVSANQLTVTKDVPHGETSK